MESDWGLLRDIVLYKAIYRHKDIYRQHLTKLHYIIVFLEDV